MKHVSRPFDVYAARSASEATNRDRVSPWSCAARFPIHGEDPVIAREATVLLRDRKVKRTARPQGHLPPKSQKSRSIPGVIFCSFLDSPATSSGAETDCPGSRVRSK